MRKLILLAAAMAGTMLSGCALGAIGGAGEVVRQVQLPAIAGLETALADDFERAAADLDNRHPRPTAAEARAVLDSADKAMARLELARLAYDATLGADAHEAVTEAIAVLRRRTDRAYATLSETVGRMTSA